MLVGVADALALVGLRLAPRTNVRSDLADQLLVDPVHLDPSGLRDDELDAVELLQSPLHEIRLLALLVMLLQYKRGTDQTAIYRAYLANTHRINNWDLVDVTAEHIIGAHLFERNRQPLYKLARSKSLWERRIAIIATFYFIRRNQFDDTLAIAGLLMNDKEDLMHKAVGWMLREVGKRDLKTEEDVLLPRYKQIPRTMLRYAIERFPETKRLAYLSGHYSQN